MRRAEAIVSGAAIQRNTARMAATLTGGAQLCAVVKADGYGHGAATAARAALQGGATWLATATAGEALALRQAGFTEPRLLVMGAVSDVELPLALEARAELVVWDHDVLHRLPSQARVHVKLDSGMGRLGTRDAAQAAAVAEAASDRGVLAGLMTHFATADDPDDDGFFDLQLERFTQWAHAVRAGRDVTVHAANSAATLRTGRAHFDLVRCGIALYGLDPANRDPAAAGLHPALLLRSYVAAVKRAEPGDSAGYGRRWIAERPTWVATVPIGYGDGWRRGLTGKAAVVIGGRRLPQIGTVSMDNITVDLGPDTDVRPGDPVTLIGDGITAEDVAAQLGTINYEVTCGLTSRVVRTVLA